MYIYSYPALKAAGKLSGFQQPQGLCVDKAGDVWVVDYGGERVVEYAHGSHKSKAMLKTPVNHNPFACSVDPNTGDLAVTASYGGDGPGYLYVYAKAKGTPKTYTDADFAYASYPGYDDKGNIWLDGTNKANKFVYAELPKGTTKFTSVKLKKPITSPGNLQFIGKYTALGDPSAGKIYQTSGSKVVGTTSFSDTQSIYGYYIDGSSVVCADGSQYVEIYAYPAGGAPTATVYFGSAASVAISDK
ncbi:MAG: hypothetical protein JO092_09915 [Candidatus Eremiobacteraeota bacterium]|nr:hypothetical protein [Candidatus Eremiobacteraeota bacterium]